MTEQLVRVAIDDATPSYDKLYTYYARLELASQVRPGMRAVLPFGNGNKQRVGMILSLEDAPAFSGDAEYRVGDKTYLLKPVIRLLDPEPVLNGEQLEMVRWLHENTFCTWYDAVKTVLPGGLQLRLHEHCEVYAPQEGAVLSEQEQRVLQTLQSYYAAGVLEQKLSEYTGTAEQEVIKSLVEKGCVALVTGAKQRVQDGAVEMLRISPGYLENAGAYRITAKQEDILSVVREYQTLTRRECAELSGASVSTVSALVKKNVLEVFKRETLRVPRGAKPTESPDNTILSAQQQAAYDAVSESILAKKAAAYLLYGVTGSGKTAVFEKLMALTLKQGREVLLLLPEIALTPQVVRYFQARFGDLVGLLHGGLTLSQRMDTYKLVKRGEIRIVIGTRSAVFAPLSDIGLIILDEEGERSYKSEQSPRYHAGDVAKMRCRHHNAALVFASATPSFESRYLAERGVYKLLRMPERYNKNPLPEVSIVDMGAERRKGNPSSFSCELAGAIAENLSRGEQSILLLNRRGYRTLVQCTNCNEPLYCPNCSVPLTYHKAGESLNCHFCGYTQPLTPGKVCPKCGGTRFRQMGIGTQYVEEELYRLFPAARVLRMDADTTVSRYAYEEGFRAFANHEYDILCGTQMIGKGLDFPNVTLVGVISVDNALFSGDFRSYERTFSLVTQVVGRSGRGDRVGRAILQTFMPEHYVLQLAAAQDYDRFYEEEILLRRALTFPPVCDICVIGVSSLMQERAAAAARHFTDVLREEMARYPQMPLRVLGPVEAGYTKIKNQWRWRVLIKCKNTASMRALVRGTIERIYAERSFPEVQFFADMNGDCGV